MKQRYLIAGGLLMASFGVIATVNVPQTMFQSAGTLSAEARPDTKRAAGGTDLDTWGGPVIYGCVNYTVNENAEEYGIYAIDGTTGMIQAVSLTDHPDANGGGIYDNGIYRFVTSDERAYHPIYFEYDTDTWQMLRSVDLPDWSNTGFDEAFDPVTGNVYGLFMDEKSMYCHFGYIDHDTHVVTRIAPVDNMVYFGIVATPDGEIYAVASDGYFYNIDKYTGARTRIGHTGISPKYNQTAVCDMETGIIYWIACDTTGTTGLYTIDRATGKAKKIRIFSKREGVVGAFIKQAPWSPGAPSKVTDFKADFDKASTTGTISFTLPTTDLNGQSLTSDVNWLVHVNSVKAASGSGAPGETVSFETTADKEGMATFAVSVSDSKGIGELFKAKRYVGYDTPSPVENLNATIVGGTDVTVTWTPSSTTQHGGYLDPEDVSYKITRFPGETMISSALRKTELTQKLSSKKYSIYRYEVTPQSHGVTGESRSTRYLAGGPAYTVPWSSDPTSDSERKLFVEYKDGDKTTLVSPYLQFDPAYCYKLTVTGNAGSDKNSVMNAKLGLKPEVESMTEPAYFGMEFAGDADLTRSTYVYAPTKGDYHIGLTYSGMGNDSEGLLINSVSVERGPLSSAPDMIDDIKVIPDMDGDTRAVVNFKAPQTTIAGKPLSSIESIRLYRDGQLVETLPNPEPGATLSITDSNAPQGNVRYMIVAANSNGEGIPYHFETYIGFDIPLPPTSLRVVDTGDCLRLSWTPPVEGVNGGFVNPENLSYIVMRNDNTILTEQQEGDFFDDPSDYSGRQRYLQYAVAAVSVAGTGSYAISPAVVAGTDYETPFMETFPGGGLDYAFWGASASTNISFRLNSAAGKDGDPGCVTFDPKARGSWSTLDSGKISMADCENPVLNYCFKALGDTDSRLEVVAILPDATEETIDEVYFKTLPAEEIWRSRGADLSKYSDLTWIRLSFRLYSGNDMSGIALDDIYVDESCGFDLSAVLRAPRVVICGEPAQIHVLVENHEAASVDGTDYMVAVYKNGEVAEVLDGVFVPPFGSADFEFDVPTDIFDSETFSVYAELQSDKDKNWTNNATSKDCVEIRLPKLPGVSNVEGTIDGTTLQINWDAPDASEFRKVVLTDDVENYEPFIITGIGDWTMSDLDGRQTFGISDGNGSYHAFPNALAPKAFIVFNDEQSGVDTADAFGRPGKWHTHSGNQSFISFQASGSASDDWMISPRLSGKAQTVSFFVRSYGVASHGAETFEVLYSIDEPSPSRFMILKEESGAPDEWTEVKADLPEGTRYFAIRCTSVSHFAFMVDDITYSSDDFSELSLIGYNVYRDRVRLNTDPLSFTEIKADVDELEADYQVTTVYDRGESVPSAPLRLGMSGVDSVKTGDIRIFAVRGGLAIYGAEGSQIEVFTPSGVNVASLKASATEFIPLPAGIYMTRIAGRCDRIVVK